MVHPKVPHAIPGAPPPDGSPTPFFAPHAQKMDANNSEAIAALYAVRVSVGISSTLSVLGAFAIILSYAAYPELRTIARQLLLNLSIADILVSLAFLLGLIQNSSKCIYLYNILLSVWCVCVCSLQ